MKYLLGEHWLRYAFAFLAWLPFCAALVALAIAADLPTDLTDSIILAGLVLWVPSLIYAQFRSGRRQLVLTMLGCSWLVIIAALTLRPLDVPF